MNHEAVRSRDIAIVGYDDPTKTLEIAFRSGSVYQYAHVPSEVHQAFMLAPSRGIYFRDHIRGKYSFQKIA